MARPRTISSVGHSMPIRRTSFRLRRDVFLVVGLEGSISASSWDEGANEARAGEVLLGAGGDVGELAWMRSKRS